MVFTTTSYEAEIRGLPAGQYVLTETAAPDGYKTVTTNFTFAVNENGTVTGAGSDEEYKYDPILHKVTMMDAIDEIEVDDVTLGMSGLPISKVAMTDGIPQLEGAVLTIKADNSNGNGGSVANAHVKIKGTDIDITSTDGVNLTFTTSKNLAFVSELTAGEYVLTEDTAPLGFDKTTDFYFKVIVVNKQYSVVPGKNNGYNVMRSDGTVVIRDYPEGVKEDPDEPEKESSVPTETVSITETTTDMQTYANLETTPVTTYPRRPVYTGPYTGTRPGNEGPGYFLDPSVTNHIDRQPTEPLESEDIKAGIYVVDTDSGSGAKDAAIGMAVVAVIASAVYALSKTLKRRRSK